MEYGTSLLTFVFEEDAAEEERWSWICTMRQPAKKKTPPSKLAKEQATGEGKL